MTREPVVITMMLRRRPQLSFEQFDEHWRGQHAELLMRHRELLRFTRYLQLPASLPGLTTAMGRSRGLAEPFDGIAEMWFDSAEELQAAGRDPAAAQVFEQVLADERRFIDLQRSHLVVGTPRIIHAEKPQ